MGMENRHPIRVVARRTGLSPHLIRAWEKRYGALTPGRTKTNHRFYSDEDLERLALLHRARLGGRSISQIARLATEELRALVERDEVPTSARRDELDATAILNSCLEAVRNLDGFRLQQSLESGSVLLTRAQLLENVVIPLMQTLGSDWRDGKLRLAQEHLATAVVVTFVAGLKDAFETPETAPLVVVATPSGQLHEIGALIASVTASSEGWQTVYLGPNVQAQAIASAAREKGARAVCLSILYPTDDLRLDDEIREIADLLPAGVSIIAGGRAVSSYSDSLDEVGAIRPASYDDLRRVLESLRQTSKT